MKKKIIDIRKLIDYSEVGHCPQPTKEEWEILRKEWNLRIDIALLKGTTIAKLLKTADKEVRSDSEHNRGAGGDGLSTFQNIENSRKYRYISSMLPRIDYLENKNKSEEQIVFYFDYDVLYKSGFPWRD